MIKYKIVENRKELTSEQITSGLDFNKISSKAAAMKSAFLKTLLIKIGLGLAFAVSGVLVCVNYINEDKQVVTAEVGVENHKDQEINSLTVAGDTADNKLISIDNSNEEVSHHSSAPDIQSALDSVELVKPSTPGIVNKDSLNKKDETIKDASAQTNGNVISKKATPTKTKLNKSLLLKTCKMWRVQNFCVLPKNVYFPNSINCNGCEYDYINCTDLKDVKAVWMTISVKGNYKFTLESEFKNITLIKASNGKSLHPVALAVSNDSYFGKKFKASKFIANYKEQMDIFLFFSEAEPGDVIIIKGLVEAMIEN